MKNKSAVICILLAAVLLSSCGKETELSSNEKSSKSSETSVNSDETTVNSEQTNSNGTEIETETKADSEADNDVVDAEDISENSDTVITDDNYKSVAENVTTLLDAFKNKDKAIVLECINATDESAVSFVDNVTIDSYELLDMYCHDENGAMLIYQSVKLSISQSSDERFPVGESTWRFYRGDLFSLVSDIVQEGHKVDKVSIDEQTSTPLVFCANYNFFFAKDTENGDFSSLEATSGNFDNYISELKYMAYYCGYNNGLIESMDDIKTAVEESLGITNVAWDQSYLAGLDDAAKYELPARGGTWQPYSLDTFSDDGETIMLTVTYYADCARFTPANIVDYTLKKNADGSLRLWSVKTTFDAGFDAWRMWL